MTVAGLTRQLRALGIVAGDRLILHSAMSSLGWVCGGPQAVIEAFTQALGPSGALIMPTHAADWSEPGHWEEPAVPDSWWPIIRDQMPASDPQSTPTRGMGRIPEAFRGMPGVLRSSHPQVSFAARGPAAGAMTAQHDLADGFGERSPLAVLYEQGAHICLLGVGFDSCTALHLAEHRADGMAPGYKPSGAALMIDGRRTWHRYHGFAYDPDDFAAIGEAYIAAGGSLQEGPAGYGRARVLPFRELVDFAADWMSVNR